MVDDALVEAVANRLAEKLGDAMHKALCKPSPEYPWEETVTEKIDCAVIYLDLIARLLLRQMGIPVTVLANQLANRDPAQALSAFRRLETEVGRVLADGNLHRLRS